MAHLDELPGSGKTYACSELTNPSHPPKPPKASQRPTETTPLGKCTACGCDAKHSFEDAIEPVWEAKAKYGDRIALLGGFDMDKLSRMPVDQVRDLWRHWDQPRIVWYQGGHVTFPFHEPVRRLLADAFRESGLTGALPARTS